MTKKKLLFVCLGNICRSPTAEAIMNKLVQEQGLSANIICDSAGTSGYHGGGPADPRSIEHGKKRNYDLTSISRPLIFEDLQKFDYILAMDERNLQDIRDLDADKEYESKIHLITDYCQEHKIKGVPDPYRSGPSGFDLVIDILEDACQHLLKDISKKL